MQTKQQNSGDVTIKLINKQIDAAHAAVAAIAFTSWSNQKIKEGINDAIAALAFEYDDSRRNLRLSEAVVTLTSALASGLANQYDRLQSVAQKVQYDLTHKLERREDIADPNRTIMNAMDAVEIGNVRGE